MDRYKWSLREVVLARLSDVTITALLRGNHSSGKLNELDDITIYRVYVAYRAIFHTLSPKDQVAFYDRQRCI